MCTPTHAHSVRVKLLCFVAVSLYSHLGGHVFQRLRLLLKLATYQGFRSVNVFTFGRVSKKL